MDGHADDCNCVERGGDVIALLTARMNDDVEGFKQILDTDPEDMAAVFIGMTDYAVATTEILASMLGVKPEVYLQSLAMVSRLVERG